jgi:hypothetical protein
MLKMENWVQLRHKCSPVEVFTEIRQEIEDDVACINGLYKKNSEVKFTTVGKNGKITVCRKGPYQSTGIGGSAVQGVICVDFVLTDWGIIVKPYEGDQQNVTLTLTDEAECKLKLKDGTELNRWQFRKRFLEDLFFNFYPNRQ